MENSVLNQQSSDDSFRALQATAMRVREHIIRMSSGGGCFIGASLSCADIMVQMYSRVLRPLGNAVRSSERDYLLLSKGHDVPALYGTMVELGELPVTRLSNHLAPTDHVYWHPNRALPGVEFHSGSLGHLLSVGIGIALDFKLRKSDQRVFVVLGDGELNEGTIWEGLLVASAHKLDNLVAIVDRNQFQANVATEDLIPLEPLAAKFSTFGCDVFDTDGHSFSEMSETFDAVDYTNGRPTIVVAHTMRGKGLPSIEQRADRWFVRFSDSEVAMLLEELRGNATAELSTETLMVR